MKALLYKTEKHVPTASGYTALENMETAGIITTYYLLGIPVYKSLKIASDNLALNLSTWQASPVTMNELGSFIAIVGVHEDSFYLR